MYIEILSSRMSRTFCNILVTGDTIWQLQMHLQKSWSRSITLNREAELTWYSLNATRRIWLNDLERGIKNQQFQTCLILPDRRGSCNPCKISGIICLLYCLFSFRTTNDFGCFRGIMAWFRLIKNELHDLLLGFQITQEMKRSTMYQRTSYHDTTNDSGYLPRLEMVRWRDICTTNNHVPKLYKTFDSS